MTRGLIKFALYVYQIESIKNFLAYDYNIINKARQLGFSTLTAALVAWLILFHNDKQVLIVSTKKDVAKNLLKKVKVILKNLPDWMYLADVVVNQAHTIGLSNGSEVKAVARSEDVGRSEALSLLIIDEAAHIKDMEEIWKGLSSTVATGGKIIALSTPKGIGNWFHKTYIEAASGENEFYHQEVFWWENPEYAEGLEDDPSVPGGKTSPWFRRFTAGWTKQHIAQELLTSFEETGDTFFETETIKYYLENAKEPIKKLGNDRNLWVWEDPIPNESYLIASDVASGTSEDYSTEVVIKISNLEIVAEYKGKKPPDVLADFLIETAKMYNNALIINEKNHIGLVTSIALRDSDYNNVGYFDNEENKLLNKWDAIYKEINPGFSTTLKTRPVILSKLEEFLRKAEIILYSKRIINELQTFVWKNGKPQARRGYTDDLIMALAIGVWIRDICFGSYSRTQVDAKSLYSSVVVNSNTIDQIMPNKLEQQKARIVRDVQNSQIHRLGNRIIDMKWIYKI